MSIILVQYVFKSHFFKETNKKPPSKKELEDIAHGLIVEQKFEGDLYGSNTKRMYEVPKNEVLKELVVPKSFKENAYTEARKLGRAKPTDEQIRAVYLYQNKIN